MMLADDDSLVRGALAAVVKAFPGAQVVEVRGLPQAAPVPPPAATPGFYSLSALALCGRRLADDIRDHQQRLVECGLRAEADVGRLADATMLDALANLADRVRADRIIIERLRALGSAPPPEAAR